MTKSVSKLTTKSKFSFTIDRSKWRKGTMLDDDGRMCAMGFVAEAIGIPKTHFKHSGRPNIYNPEDRKKWGEAGFLKCNGSNIPVLIGVVDKVIRTNDNSKIDTKTREKKLKEIFSEVGIKLKFKGRKAHGSNI